MTTLAQLLGIRKTRDRDTETRWTKIYHTFQSAPAFVGMVRHYDTFSEEPVPPEEVKPDEVQKVQQTYWTLMGQMKELLIPFLDMGAQVDLTNTQTTAEVVVGDTVLLREVPPTYLMWLQHQLEYLLNVVGAIPVQDPALRWSAEVDASAGAYTAEPTTTQSNRKQSDKIVLWEPPDASYKQPAQVQLITLDVPAGTWTTVRHTGAMPQQMKDQLLRRVNTLLDAVKQARIEANACDVAPPPGWGKAVMDYIWPDQV